MSAYYNEIDPYAAQWLRNLIKKGLIARGDVDERDIRNVSADDVRGYTQCHFFAGIGGWSYALRLAGWPDGRPCWTGSCPCQPFSTAGNRGGLEDDRHLWPDWSRLIKKRRPPIIFGEQVASAIKYGWLDLVSDDMERCGYAFGAAILPAACVGAPHIRHRLFFCAANPDSQGLQRTHEHGEPRAPEVPPAWRELTRIHAAAAWATWLSESGDSALVDGLSSRVGEIRAYGNAIEPHTAATFISAADAAL